ncbi:uncharacterized protein CLAFUR5_13093 [Fulvia fulva]|uniref:Uncharacterized protein n=1 Tax=Passalora fulva TaxID=5499 RepID=A0A9Q8PJ70_PASFU|nr:uncharacterized protein CLAFUR5_13093 [Fulvia fulva]KAK4612659.1 hypothetical protein CLAFUR0_13247 [Fulvia fulva]UJO23390.1 hypothetical protein CLAFUR5_13093 [Fulvia fulva]
MAHINRINTERLRPDGDFEYRIGTSRHFQHAKTRDVTDKQVQEYRERMIDEPKTWERDFEVERIAGHDEHDCLVIFKPHYRTGLEVRPGWFRHNVLSNDLIQAYKDFVAETDKEYAAAKEEQGVQTAQASSKVARLIQGAFQAQVMKPVGAKLREVVLERYPDAFRIQDAMDGRDATAQDGNDEAAANSRDRQKSEEPTVPFYEMTTGIVGEDSTHYLFLNTGGSARWVQKTYMSEEWTGPYKMQKEQLIRAFQGHTGGQVDYQGSWRPDLHLHGMFPAFLVLPSPISAEVREEVEKRYPGLLHEEGASDDASTMAH